VPEGMLHYSAAREASQKSIFVSRWGLMLDPIWCRFALCLNRAILLLPLPPMGSLSHLLIVCLRQQLI